MSLTDKQIQDLIQTLHNSQAEFGDRHDAAMDLGAFHGAVVELALAKIACDIDADEDMVDACAESLAEIWCRQNSLNHEILARLTPVGSRVALALLSLNAPALALEASKPHLPTL